jgi:hypothetical protein
MDGLSCHSLHLAASVVTDVSKARPEVSGLVSSVYNGHDLQMGTSASGVDHWLVATYRAGVIVTIKGKP